MSARGNIDGLLLGRAPAKGKEQVELLARETDEFGDGGETVTIAIFKKCVVLPRDSTEQQDVTQGFYTIAGYQVFIPPQPDLEQVRSTALLKVRGAVVGVEGKPAIYADLSGKVVMAVAVTTGEVS